MCAAVATRSLFSDKIFTATDLAKKATQVLNSVADGPVTISRNGELFAIVMRHDAAKLYEGMAAFSQATEVVKVVLDSIQGAGVYPTYHWVTAFDLEEKRAMCTEIVNVVMKANNREGEWSAVGDLIHQWKESGIALQAGELAGALEEPEEMELLSSPCQQVADEAREVSLSAAR